MTLHDLKLCMAYPRMTVRMLAVMFELSDEINRKLSLRYIAEKLDVPKPSVSRAFDALVRMKMIKRIRGEDDRRDVYAILTDKGVAFVEGINHG